MRGVGVDYNGCHGIGNPRQAPTRAGLNNPPNRWIRGFNVFGSEWHLTPLFVALYAHFTVRCRPSTYSARGPICRRTPMQLSLSTRTIEGIIIVDCAGRLVFGDESGTLRETVKKLLPAYKQIVLNMKGVMYIDSGGLGTLISLYSSVRAAGGELKLASLSAKTLELLQITKLLTVFDIRDTETDAVLSFAKSAGAH